MLDGVLNRVNLSGNHNEVFSWDKIAQWLANSKHTSGPSCPSLIPSVPKYFSEEKIVNVAEVNPWRCLEESGQWLDNVN